MQKGKAYKLSHKLCKGCKYYYSYIGICGYCVVTGKSRVYDHNGERKVSKGYCITYEYCKDQRHNAFFDV